MKKETLYVRGAVSLWIASLLITGCSSGGSTTPEDTTWANQDTTQGKVVRDREGNEWIWHSGSNMLMGYWLINSLRGQAPMRYYPSGGSYSYDNGTPTTRPAHVATAPVKSSEARMATPPTTAQPLNRSAIRSGYAVPSSQMAPASRSTRSGFGSTGRSSSTGAAS